IAAIPVSALRGDNVVVRGGAMPWYQGQTLLACLESIPIDSDRLEQRPFRMPVQWVNRRSPEFRGFAGTIASGMVRRGERVRVLPSGRDAEIARIVTHAGDLEQAVAGEAVTLSLSEEIDVSRGDVFAAPGALPAIADRFEATVVWMAAEPLRAGRHYLVKMGTRTVPMVVSALKHQ